VLAGDEPVVVVIGRDGTRVGELVHELEAEGRRAAAFVGDPASEQDALVEMLKELFGARGPEPAAQQH
jgi:hypothetical protein